MSHSYRQVRRPRARRPSPPAVADKKVVLCPNVLLPLFAARSLEMLIDAVFDVLHTVVPCAFASAFYRSAGGGLLKERDSRGREYTREFVQLHGELTPARPIALANPGIRILATRDRLAVNDAELRRMRFYRDIMRPQGWRHAVALCFWGDAPPTVPICVFSVHRTDGETDFTDEELARLDEIYPSIDTSINLMCERDAANAVIDGLAATVRDPARGFAVMNWSLQLVRANAAARQLARIWILGPHSRPIRRRALTWQTPAEISEACEALRKTWETLLIDNPDVIGVRRQLRAEHPTMHGLTATVTLIGPTTVGVSPPGFVVELNRHGADTAAGPSLSSPLMNHLTTAERQVALCLANGLSNQEIADRLGKSVPAVKYLLHRIYTKTSLPSRAAVVAALRHAGSPQHT